MQIKICNVLLILWLYRGGYRLTKAHGKHYMTIIYTRTNVVDKRLTKEETDKTDKSKAMPSQYNVRLMDFVLGKETTHSLLNEMFFKWTTF